MNRTFALAAASSIALSGCEVSTTNNQAAADIPVNAPSEPNAMPDTNAAAPATNAAAPVTNAAVADEHQYGPAPNTLPAGAQLAVLHGDPGRAGPFVIRLRFPAGYSVGPHWHPVTETVTVISGNLSFGMGNKLDRSAARQYGPGGFIVTGPRENHYAFTDTGATIQVAAEGPFQITYVNAADDPRNTPAG